jgi:hypothetical protein
VSLVPKHLLPAGNKSYLTGNLSIKGDVSGDTSLSGSLILKHSFDSFDLFIESRATYAVKTREKKADLAFTISW